MDIHTRLLMPVIHQNRILRPLFFITGLIFAVIISTPGLAYPLSYFNGLNLSRMTSQNLPDTSIIENRLAIDTPTLVSDQFSFTEGPAADKEGNIYFTDQPNNKIWKYDINGKLSLFMEGTRRSNGMFFDENGNLVSCADEQNQLVAINPAKKISVLINDFKGQNFNGPNDVWVNPTNGDMYFTDPFYKRDYWKEGHTHMKEERVYYLGKNKSAAIIVDDLIKKPNGIVGTADGKKLFVADIGDNKTYSYQINDDGMLTDRELFVNQGSDGMTIDQNGNIYLTGKGVTVYNPKGEKIQHFDIPEEWTGNICFGGKHRTILFITASKSIYVLHMNVKGVQ